jgi:hypothetical protein
MIAERISLGAIYKTLLQLENNEGKVYNIVLNYKIGAKTISPPVFDNLEALKTFINKNYPYKTFYGDDLICTWQPFTPVKFWVDKENDIQVSFKENLETTKNKLYKISEKRLRELTIYIKQVERFINFDSYIAPSTPTYVECVYINDVINDGGYEKALKEYKKYTKL